MTKRRKVGLGYNPEKNFNLTKVNVLATYEHQDQLMGDLVVIVDWERDPIQRELYVLEQVINSLGTQQTTHDLKHLAKISLAYAIDEEYDGDHWDFIMRSNSKYYFAPDQRDFFEEAVVKRIKHINVASKTAPIKIST